MNPNEVFITHKPRIAPITPYGAAANTRKGLMALLNWNSSAR